MDKMKAKATRDGKDAVINEDDVLLINGTAVYSLSNGLIRNNNGVH